jgi:ureidoacrylate peracid hydrolase
MNADATLPLTLAEKLQPQAAALLVIDMQNDFCAKGGYIDAVMKKDVGAAATIVGAIDRLLAAARARGVPVVWVKADYSHERIPEPMLAKLRSRGITAVCCRPGTWGADFFGVRPAGDETQVVKHSYSGFIGTELEPVLRGLGARTLVCVGVQTQVCVESTVRDGHSLGYFCVVPQDAVASHTPALHDATLDNIRFLFGDVCAARDVVDAWSTTPADN